MNVYRLGWFVWVLLPALSFASCKAGGSDSGTDSAMGTDADSGAPACMATGDTFDLTGTFAVESVIQAMAVINIESRQYFLTTYVQNGTDVTMETRVCTIDLPSVPELAEVTIPMALQDLARARLYMESGPYLSGTTVCATFMPAEQVIVFGADLANPATDPLPTEMDLSTALDEDGDGNPGVTVEADVATCPTNPQYLYVAMRSIGTFMGTVFDSNTIAGDIDASLEQEVLGVSDPCLAPASMIEINILPGSTFRSLRVDGVGGAPDLDTDADGTIDCTELDVARDMLFGSP